MSDLIVDTHVHIFNRNTPLLDDKWTPNGEEAPLEDLMACFKVHGVAYGVLSTASIYGLYNDYFREALKRFPRLRATANLAPDADAHTFEQMSREGFCGIRLLWRGLAEAPDLGGEPYRRLLRRCADNGWHVHLTDRADRIGTTITVLEAAGVRVIVDHMGMIDTEAGIGDPGFRAILDAVERGRTWVKLSGAFRYTGPSRPREAARTLIGATGWERLMWGSDWPFVGHMGKIAYKDTLACLDWVEDAAMRQRIAAATALDFYF